MKLVVGLGNPGKKYEKTRHNLGFQVVDYLAAENGFSVQRKLCDALVGEWLCEGGKIIVAKPQTYMNRSGQAVKELLRENRASANDLVVIYDDLDLPFGRIRLRPKGGAGGHRGVFSILEHLAGAPFYRVRVGIGRPPEGVDPAAFVLEPFSSQELSELGKVVEKANDAVVSLLCDGGEKTMDRYNRLH